MPDMMNSMGPEMDGEMPELDIRDLLQRRRLQRLQRAEGLSGPEIMGEDDGMSEEQPMTDETGIDRMFEPSPMAYQHLRDALLGEPDLDL